MSTVRGTELQAGRVAPCIAYMARPGGVPADPEREQERAPQSQLDSKSFYHQSLLSLTACFLKVVLHRTGAASLPAPSPLTHLFVYL